MLMRQCMLMLTVLAFGLSPAAAQDGSSANAAEEPGEATTASRAVERVELGLRVLEYGRAQQDPRALLVAAQLLSDLPPAEGDAADIGKLDISVILDDAERLAGDDEDLLEQVAELRAAESRGCVGTSCGGPIRLERYVPSQTVWNVDVNARGGELLIVAARRDTRTPVGMRLYDENDYLVCKDTTGDVVITCKVTAAWTGPIRVEMTNYGTVGTGIVMVTN